MSLNIFCNRNFLLSYASDLISRCSIHILLCEQILRNHFVTHEFVDFTASTIGLKYGVKIAEVKQGAALSISWVGDSPTASDVGPAAGALPGKLVNKSVRFTTDCSRLTNAE